MRKKEIKSEGGVKRGEDSKHKGRKREDYQP